MVLSENGKKFIQKEEGCILHSYKDAVNVWTIGYGNTFYTNGTPVKQGEKITQQQADDLFNLLIPKFEIPVNKLSGLTQNQHDALTSLTWNIGTGGFIKSTLFSKVQDNPNNIKLIKVSDITEVDLKNQLVKEKRDFLNTLEYSFLVWCRAGGKFNIDLYHRRNREYKLYSTK